jgi:predicted heme/steroid binding protein
MKRPITATAAIIIVMILVLTACSAGPNTSSSATAQPSAGQGQSAAAQASDTGKVFTLDELKKYDGQNGNPAYAAVNGIVYDLTNAKVWNNGSHNIHKAGADLTAELAQSPHGDRILSGLPVVGTLKQ